MLCVARIKNVSLNEERTLCRPSERYMYIHVYAVVVANPAEDRLYEMLQDREVHHIPVHDASESVNVKIQLALQKFIQLVGNMYTVQKCL